MYFSKINLWFVTLVTLVVMDSTNANIFETLGITENTTVLEYFARHNKTLLSADTYKNSQYCIDYNFGSSKIRFLQEGIPSVVRAYFVRKY